MVPDPVLITPMSLLVDRWRVYACTIHVHPDHGERGNSQDGLRHGVYLLATNMLVLYNSANRHNTINAINKKTDRASSI